MGEEMRQAEYLMWYRLLCWSAAFTVPVVIIAMVLPHVPHMSTLLGTMVLGFPARELLKWALTTPVQFWIGARFHTGAYRALRSGRYTPNSLLKACGLQPQACCSFCDAEPTCASTGSLGC